MAFEFDGDMQLPQRLARFNRHVTNPIQRMWAAGGAQMRRHGKTFSVSNPRTVTKEQAAPHVSGAARRVSGRLPFEQAVLLTKTG
jgi:hypothetical protein